MARVFRVGLAAAVVFVVSGRSSTWAAPVLPGVGTVPALIACLGDDCRDLSSFIEPTDEEAEGKTTYVFEDVFVEWPTGTALLSGFYNPDPLLLFNAITTNMAAVTNTFTFLFGTPVVPGLYSAAASIAQVDVTNGDSGTSTVAPSAVYPRYVSGYGTDGSVPTNLGVDLGNLPCVAGPGAPGAVTESCFQGLTLSGFSPTFFDNLEVLLTYTQTDNSSEADWFGVVAISVPEPALCLLLGGGILGIFRRQRRSPE